MNSLFWISYSLLWIILCVLLILVLLLYRQFGLLSMEPRQRISLSGIPIGSRLPAVAAELLPESPGRRKRTSSTSDDAIANIWPDDASSARVVTIVLGGPECPICKELWPAVNDLPSQRTESNWIWVDGAPRADNVPPGWTYAVSADLSVHRLFEAPMLPFAYVADGATGKVLAKGLVNSPTDLISLLEDAAVESARSRLSSAKHTRQLPIPRRQSTSDHAPRSSEGAK
jgi:hypothetical protein